MAWFAGLFYIFRLYVYHAENQAKPEVVAVLETMERRLHRMIMGPAMIFATAMGVVLLVKNPALLKQGWFHVKLSILLFLYTYHFFSGYVRRQFSKKNYFLTHRQCRLINEVPTVILVIVVLIAVMKPF